MYHCSLFLRLIFWTLVGNDMATPFVLLCI